MVVTLLASNWPNVTQVRVNAVAPGSSIFSSTAAANYGEELAPFELAKPGVPAKRLGTTFEVVLILKNETTALSFVLLEVLHFVSLNFTVACHASGKSQIRKSQIHQSQIKQWTNPTLDKSVNFLMGQKINQT